MTEKYHAHILLQQSTDWLRTKTNEVKLTRAMFNILVILLDMFDGPPGGSMPPNPGKLGLETTGDPMPGKPALGNDRPRLSPPNIPPLVLVGSTGISIGFGKPLRTGNPAVTDAACCCCKRRALLYAVREPVAIIEPVAIRSRVASSGDNFIVNRWASLHKKHSLV
jgi:hypothetical protein